MYETKSKVYLFTCFVTSIGETFSIHREWVTRLFNTFNNFLGSKHNHIHKQKNTKKTDDQMISLLLKLKVINEINEWNWIKQAVNFEDYKNSSHNANLSPIVATTRMQWTVPLLCSTLLKGEWE
jgi:hypothetical protein